MRLATTASVTVAVVLVLGKLATWALTDSVSLLSSLIDSLMDVAASLVNFLAVRHALMPPDPEHRFGHGKAEPLAGLAQSAFIVGSAVFLLIEAVHRLVHPAPVAYGLLGIVVMGGSLVLTLALVAFQGHVVRVTRSSAIDADALHYRSDLAMNGTVIAAILLSDQLGWTWADPVFALAIAVFIFVAAGRIARRSLDVLMDRELPEADRARIRDLVLAHPEARSLHDLRTRGSGMAPFIQFHLELDPALTLLRAHRISDEIEASLRGTYRGSEIIIHQDPAGYETPPELQAT
ncbi:MAG: cation diffusion facilitator family transporter [Alphaproteobacteria bacterium]|nr:cation diffusion facilitator family transporter [Alphaproteobacteria bacterium]